MCQCVYGCVCLCEWVGPAVMSVDGLCDVVLVCHLWILFWLFDVAYCFGLLSGIATLWMWVWDAAVP